ncbi:T9SS type A sorting domain-containing protein [Rhodocaloribacter litoris]|uniref:T9SS type A sorting domain-containing protein n=1 Tax=Rhodocaloribacter litoris TaxID=2558931 RepID=UPI0014228D31|nr:T9SS type A sorting domain-containing protein [Rhodocaloribacter litoris]QXD16438.1 T9SS type A sorting domain-containing protein [Rhodocaloribacter litoris]
MRTATLLRHGLMMLAVIAVFAGPALAQRTVTLQLNTATLPDTVDAMDEIQVRGAIDGTGGVTLPDGNVIDWNDNTTLKPANIGGDYWQISFQIPDNSELKFKFYSQLAEDHLIGGWEDGSSNTDSDGNHIIEAGTGDVELPLHFFVKGERQPYDWRPYEMKEDSIAVWFRVYMNTESAIAVGYDPATSEIAVRGDGLGGLSQLDWGTNNVVLTQESTDDTKPGYHLFSGVAYYPTAAAGMTQPYKFIVGADGWESGIDNRTFTVPTSDTTLHWVYFDNSKPVVGEVVTHNVIFSVDLTPLEEIGIFSRARGDTLQVRGDFNGWGCSNPDLCLLQRIEENFFEGIMPLTLVPGTEVSYKYFIDFNNEPFIQEFGKEPPDGWEEPITTTGSDRVFVFASGTADQFLGDQRFNDIFEGNIIPEGNDIALTFSVDMTPALSNNADPFDPAGGDSVFVTFGDPIWRFTQDLADTDRRTLLTDADGDGIYTGTITISGPTYSGIQYQYTYGQGNELFTEPGQGLGSEPGRRRTRFIVPNGDGTWPSAWAFPQETFEPAQTALPFERNPALVTGIETVEGEVPTRISLGQNFPNPFNPRTTFEYTIDRTMDVKVRVYDVLGRVVATLVDGVQPAATYRVTFDAGDLASGLYLYRLETPNQVITRRMVLLK